MIACALAAVWLGNAAITVWLRESASAETLRGLLSLGFVLYASWHFAKAAFFQPESPFDWTPTERELLIAMPLRPRDLVGYQLASVTVTTLLKAGLFTLLLWPDLRCIAMGLVGLLLAMMTLEMLRMAIDIATWGMGRRAFVTFRVAVVAALVAGGIASAAVIAVDGALGRQDGAGDGVRRQVVEAIVHWNHSALGYAALPFQPFIDLMLADRISASYLALAAVALAIVMVLAAGVIALYAATCRRVVERENREYLACAPSCAIVAGSNQYETAPFTTVESTLRLRRTPRCCGVTALAWRQLVGARRHWGGLLAAMIAPAVLACIPGFVVVDPYIAFLATTATLAFYTFLLLPTALRFDFRRDLDRLVTLKGLPISPAAAAIGQTLAPVLIATVFQCGVLAFEIAARSLPAHYLFVAMLVMAPLNVLVFSLDNLIFLLYPYRQQQEGLEIFLRTMLTFTGKGLLFALGLKVMAVWGFIAAALAHRTNSIDAYTLFTVGMVVGPSLLATLVLYGVCRTYRTMNPIEDIPR